MKVVLASGSPRRKELLKRIVPEFEVIVSEIDETLEKELSLKEQVEKLSYLKTKSVFDKTKGDRIIVGADTVVVKDTEIYGKPSCKEQATEMIKKLLKGDRTHQVVTGLTVMVNKNNKTNIYQTSDEVKVFLKPITDMEIENWIETGKAMDKAGAYGMQEEFCVFVEKIEGNYHTAIGLPTQKLYDILKEIEKKLILRENK